MLYGTCSNEIHFRTVLEDEAQLDPVETEAGILSAHHAVSHHLHKELPVLLLQPLQTSQP